MILKQSPKEDAEHYWKEFCYTHPDVKLKDVYVMYTVHTEGYKDWCDGVITKEFVTYEEINKQWGDDWEAQRKEAGNKTKRDTPYFYTKHRAVTLVPVVSMAGVQKILKKKETMKDVMEYTDQSSFEKDKCFNIQWCTRSW